MSIQTIVDITYKVTNSVRSLVVIFSSQLFWYKMDQIVQIMVSSIREARTSLNLNIYLNTIFCKQIITMMTAKQLVCLLSFAFCMQTACSQVTQPPECGQIEEEVRNYLCKINMLQKFVFTIFLSFFAVYAVLSTMGTRSSNLPPVSVRLQKVSRVFQRCSDCMYISFIKFLHINNCVCMKNFIFLQNFVIGAMLCTWNSMESRLASL